MKKFCAGVVMLAISAHAHGQVLSPGTSVGGRTQGEWSAVWWQQVYSVPTLSNPLADATGAFAGAGDQGEVFFLYGSTGGAVSRSATVRNDQSIFLPLINASFYQDDPASQPESFIRADLDAFIGSTQSQFLRIDGVSAPVNLFDHRQIEPAAGFFPLTVADNNVFGGPSGSFGCIADGYWAMLSPLSVGTHTVDFGGQIDFNGDVFEVSISYELTVVPAPGAMAICGVSLSTLAVDRRRRPATIRAITP